MIGDACNQVERVGVATFSHVRFRGIGMRAWMRVVKAHNLETPGPRIPERTNVIARVDLKAGGTRREIDRAYALENLITRSDKDAAALARGIITRVGAHIVQHSLDDRDHSASTTMAIPMPPPMHRAATP